MDNVEHIPLKRVSFNEVIQALSWCRSLKAFPNHPDDVVANLLRVATLTSIKKGMQVYARNDPVDTIYVIRSGVIEISNLDDITPGDMQQVYIRRLHVNEKLTSFRCRSGR